MAVEFEHIDVKIDPNYVAIRFVRSLGTEFRSAAVFAERVERLAGMNTVRIDWVNNQNDMDLTEVNFNRDVSIFIDRNGDTVGMDIRRAADHFSPAQLEVISSQSGQLITV